MEVVAAVAVEVEVVVVEEEEVGGEEEDKDVSLFESVGTLDGRFLVPYSYLTSAIVRN